MLSRRWSSDNDALKLLMGGVECNKGVGYVHGLWLNVIGVETPRAQILSNFSRVGEIMGMSSRRLAGWSLSASQTISEEGPYERGP